VAHRQHLVVVLPGIGGSVLARPGKPDEVVWDAGKGDIADLLLRPGRMSLAEWPRLEPIGLIRSPKLLGFTVAHGYERLLTQLGQFGTVDVGNPYQPVRDADVVAVPYDFRRSIVDAAERLDTVVGERLRGISEADRSARVIVVAHSMGGLVARHWLGPLARWPWCRALITLGTPHRGAPKALDWLVNGVRVGGRRLSGPTRLLREWPSVTQLLPRYPAVQNTALSGAATNGSALYPHELPFPWLATAARDAYDLHLRIEQAWTEMPRGGPEMVACMGWSHPTPDAAWWDGASLTVRKTPPDWLDPTGWEKDLGDGTVPSVSALPTELDNYASSPIRLAQRHGPLASSSIVVDRLRAYEDRRPPRHFRGDERGDHPPAIGLDLDDVHAAAAPIPVRATLREVEADVTGQSVWASLRRIGEVVAGSARPIDLRLEWDDEGACFHGALPGQPPGLYTVQVSAREIPGAGDLHASDTLAVIEGG